jgi:glycine betaine/proline transport system permease protein
MFEDKVIPLDVWVSQFVDWLVDNYRDVFQALKWPVEQTLNGFDAGLNALSPLIVIAVLALAAWKFSGKGLAIFTVITLTSSACWASVGWKP